MSVVVVVVGLEPCTIFSWEFCFPVLLIIFIVMGFLEKCTIFIVFSGVCVCVCMLPRTDVCTIFSYECLRARHHL